MKKLLNKLSSSGNLREEPADVENLHYRKPTTLPSDERNNSEDFKLRKSFSLSKATSPRYKDSMSSDDFANSKKKSSSGIKKDKETNKESKEKLYESDDKMLRKSSSAKSPSLLRSNDQVRNPETMRSPSLKGIFTSYEHHRDIGGDSDSSEDEDAFVPRHSPTHEEEFYSTPIRVPSAPARMGTSPTPSLHPRAASPRVTTPTSPKYGASSPTQIAYSPPASPFHSGSPTARVPSFTQSPPTNAQVPTPHVVVADDFDAKFESASISDGAKLGAEFENPFGRDSADEMDMEDEVMHQKKGTRFFGSNKPRKLKA